MRHAAAPDFWTCFENLPSRVQDLARKNFKLLKDDTTHASLHFKKMGKYLSVRIGLRYRALGVEIPEGVLWFWIGSHADYDKLVK